MLPRFNSQGLRLKGIADCEVRAPSFTVRMDLSTSGTCVFGAPVDILQGTSSCIQESSPSVLISITLNPRARYIFNILIVHFNMVALERFCVASPVRNLYPSDIEWRYDSAFAKKKSIKNNDFGVILQDETRNSGI